MAGIKSGNTRPETIVRSVLHKMGYRFRLHRKDLPGKPDIVLPRHRKVIFVHGCFWHGHPGCPRSKRPETNREFWNRKLDDNMRRDAEAESELSGLGWQVLVIWQCEIARRNLLVEKIKNFMKPKNVPSDERNQTTT